MNIYNLNNINNLGKKLEQLEQNLGDQTESGLQRSNFGKIAGTMLEQSWNKLSVCEAKTAKTPRISMYYAENAKFLNLASFVALDRYFIYLIIG